MHMAGSKFHLKESFHTRVTEAMRTWHKLHTQCSLNVDTY